MRGSFGVYCVTHPFFSCSEQLFLCFTQFGSSTHCLKFVKFHDTAPLRRCGAKKGTFSYAMKEYITARELESHCRAVFQDCHSPDMIHYQRWSQHLMLSETFVSLPYNKLFHFDIIICKAKTEGLLLFLSAEPLKKSLPVDCLNPIQQ